MGTDQLIISKNLLKHEQILFGFKNPLEIPLQE